MAEQTQAPGDIALAAAIARHVELQLVALRTLKAELTAPRVQALKLTPWDARIEKSATFEFDDVHDVIRVQARLELEVVGRAKGQTESTGILNLACVLDLDYAYDAKAGPRGDERDRHLATFASVNGIYNAWPYFREVVQSTAARMGLPPLTLPVHRVSSPTASKSAPAGKGEPVRTSVRKRPSRRPQR